MCIAKYGTYLLGALQRRHDCLGIGFKKLYPKIFFPGKGELDAGKIPEMGKKAQSTLHYADPSTWRNASKTINDFSPAGVLLTWWVSFWALHLGWLSRKISSSCPVVFLVHNALPHESKFFDPPAVRWALKKAKGFIVHSEEDGQKLKEWFPEKKVIRRPHPIYYDHSQYAISREEARSKLGITERMLLFFGFVRPYKGLDVALEAFSLLGPEFNDLKLWVAGEFWDDEARYLKLIDKYRLKNRVTIESGYLSDEDLAIRLSACEGVVLPYKSATGSGVLSTAYALNRPVIATRCGCIPDMVFHEESGILCQPDDARSFAEGIRAFYSGEGTQRFVSGIERAKREFSWDKIVDAFEELIGNE